MSGHTAGAVVLDPHTYTPESQSARERMEGKLKSHLRKVRDAVLTAAGIRKADEDIPERLKRLLDDDTFWDELWVTLPPDLIPELEDAALAGASRGVLDAIVHYDRNEMIRELNAIARDWAQQRGAELVGMRYDEDGNLVPNPNASMVISDTTRDSVRRIVTDAFEHETDMRDLEDAIKNAGTFSDERAAMIARTEVSRAQAFGNAASWQQTGVVETARWQTSNLPGVCPTCLENAAAGEVPFGTNFPSGDPWPTAHPNCRCVLVAVKLKRPE